MSVSSVYRFKDIRPVLDARGLVDVVLSKTQRKTPTEVHKQFKISRIRYFYVRKIKFAQELFREKLNTILTDFPKLDDIHPFYADLFNILYDRDHYKLALGQCSYVNKVLQKIAGDYIKLIKYSSSLYKCKMLKIAALGRMCTAVKKLQSSLVYLEEVRQHLSRLPCIDPHSKTVILSGFPNVGKSSFLNYVTRADVDVQAYPFTTTSLYVGHFTHCDRKYQVIDTPGLLDRPLEERNTIEMTTVTALAHINSIILFLIDISETCGYSIERQVSLFCSLKSLFRNKPVIIGLNKIDKVMLEHLSMENKMMIRSIADDSDIHFLKYAAFCTLSGVGIEEVKQVVTDIFERQSSSLLAEEDALMNKKFKEEIQTNRKPYIPQSVIEQKLANLEKAKKEKQVTNGNMNPKQEMILKMLEENGDMHNNANGNLNSNPNSNPNSNLNSDSEGTTKTRVETIETQNIYMDSLKNESETVADSLGIGSEGGYGSESGIMPDCDRSTMKAEKLKKKNKSRQGYLAHRTDNKILSVDLQNEHGGPGVYSADIRKNYDIDKKYTYDVIPEIYNGKNIADFVDADVEHYVRLLEKEEEEINMLDPSSVEINPLYFKMVNALKTMSLRLQGIRETSTMENKSSQIYHKRIKHKEELEKKIDELKLEKKEALMKRLSEIARKNEEQKKRKEIAAGIDIQKKVRKSICKDNESRISQVGGRGLHSALSVYKDPVMAKKMCESTSTELQRRRAYKLNLMAYKRLPKGKKSDADRSIPAKKPRHLFSGKRSIGKTSRR